MAFVPPNLERDDVISHLNKNLQAKGQGGLVCSLTETMFKSVFVNKVNCLLENESVPPLVATKTLGIFAFFHHARSQFLNDHS